MPTDTGMQRAARDLCGQLFPTTQYYRMFLATFSDQRSLWNGPIMSGSLFAAKLSTTNSLHETGSFFTNLTVTLPVTTFVTFRQHGSPIRCSQKSAIRSYPESAESTPCFSKINLNGILPYVMFLTVEFAADPGTGLH